MLKTAITYKKDQRMTLSNIGVFTNLSGICHGFSWSRENMSYKHGEKEEVKEHIQKFLRILGMQHMKYINMGCKHSDRIIDITQESIEKNMYINEYGEQVIDGDCFFTQIHGLVLCVKPADCTVCLIKAIDKNGKDVLGLVHLGRNSLELELAKKAIIYLVCEYGVKKDTIRIGVTPSIAKEYYLITYDLEKPLITLEKWGKYATLNFKKDTVKLDILRYLLKQLIEVGINDKQIEAYAVDTYKACEANESFSHRYATQHPGVKEGRMIAIASVI